MPPELRRQLLANLDDFWMRPTDLRILDVMRRCFGALLLVWVGWLWIDRQVFFGVGSWLPPAAAFAVLDPDAWSLYSLVSGSPFQISASLILLAICGIAMIFGAWPRLAAAAGFLLLVAIQHANNLLMDSEDAVIRLFAFYFIFVPPIRSLQPSSSEEMTRGLPAFPYPAWPLRLFQIQMSLIYGCTAIQKSDGAEWLDGTALYYVFRLDDAEKFPMPGSITESLGVLKLLTWAVLIFEMLVPFLLWCQSTRRWILVVTVSFHLLTHYSMNLHLFHWAMLIGLMSFLNYEEWQAMTNSRHRSTAPSNIQQK